MNKDGKAFQLSQTERFQGRVISRVNGLLAVSRSFGDFELEAFITPDPDIFTLSMDELSEGNQNDL